MDINYKIKRLSETEWDVDGIICSSVEMARDTCQTKDGLRGATWDFPTAGECVDGLEAMPIGSEHEYVPQID